MFMKPFVRILLLFCLILTAALRVGANPVSGQPQPGEYKMKVAFLLNILTFVEWPGPMMRDETLRVCVMADPSVVNAFNELSGQIAAGRKIATFPVTQGDSLGTCHVLFIGPQAEHDLPRIMKALEGSSVLTVGDTAGFARQGVIINFYLQDNKVRFDINAAAARQAGLTISSKLLKLAGSVYGATPGGE
jgi:YfiR/HmsC-like